MKKQLQYQRGVVLVVALIMLLVMTGVGVTLMSGATLQERMAGNNRQLAIARMNAEGALRQAEQALDALDILDPTTIPHEVIAQAFNPASDGRFVDLNENVSSSSTSLLINSDILNDDLSISTNWTTTNSVSAAATNTASTAPRYTIEYIGRLNSAVVGSEKIDISDDKKYQDSNAPYVFRITAIGFGANDDIYAVLQNTYSTGTP